MVFGMAADPSKQTPPSGKPLWFFIAFCVIGWLVSPHQQPEPAPPPVIDKPDPLAIEARKGLERPGAKFGSFEIWNEDKPDRDTVTGVVFNASNRSFNYVKLESKFYWRGAVAATPWTNIAALGPYEKWRFKLTCFDDFDNYEITSVHGQ